MAGLNPCGGSPPNMNGSGYAPATPLGNPGGMPPIPPPPCIEFIIFIAAYIF